MEKSIIKVDGMSCEHCVKSITKAVGALQGVDAVTVDLEGKTVSVEHNPVLVSIENIKFTIEEQGYDVILS
jgi:copper chaperone